jgi:acetylornithine deacetylase/succinyl-diaminopimelate desuccinylase-like protein
MGKLDAGLADEIGRAVEDRRDGAVGLLQELVSVPSVTGDEGAVQEVVERAFRERGLEVDRWEATAEEVLLYREHVDTVASRSFSPPPGRSTASSSSGAAL